MRNGMPTLSDDKKLHEAASDLDMYDVKQIVDAGTANSKTNPVNGRLLRSPLHSFAVPDLRAVQQGYPRVLAEVCLTSLVWFLSLSLCICLRKYLSGLADKELVHLTRQKFGSGSWNSKRCKRGSRARKL